MGESSLTWPCAARGLFVPNPVKKRKKKKKKGFDLRIRSRIPKPKLVDPARPALPTGRAADSKRERTLTNTLFLVLILARPAHVAQQKASAHSAVP